MKATPSCGTLLRLAALAGISLSSASFAQVWNKPSGTADWTNGANWNGGILPSSGTSIETQVVNGHAELSATGGSAHSLYLGGTGGGARGTATITVKDGATFVSRYSYLGVGVGGTGTLNVTGAQTTWTNINPFYLSMGGGSGALNLTQGAALTTEQSAFVGWGTGSTANALISGSGSQWTSLGAFIIGGFGSQGTLTLANGGSLKMGTNGNGKVTIGYLAGANSGTLNIGNGGAAGTLQALGVTVSANSVGKVNFNHNESGYSFTGSLEGNLSVEQKGSGTTILTHTGNTYTGGTTVTGGRLVANNISGSAFGTGSVLVNASTTLAGNGRFTGSATIFGTYAPGNSVGNLTSGDLIFRDTGVYEWEINNAGGNLGNPSSGWDHATVNGVLTFEPGAMLKIASLGLNGLNGPAAGFDPNQSYLWTIATVSGGIDGIENVTIDTSGFLNSFNGIFSLSENGNRLQLAYTPVPEPAGAALFAAGVLILAGSRRRAAC